MQDKNSNDFEEKVREFLSTFGFQDVSGGPTFKIGGKQIDACGGIGDTLLVVDATTTKSNIPSKITNLRGNIDVYKRMDIQKDGMPQEQYKKYKEVMLVVATKSLVDDKLRERAMESNIHVKLWDKQFFQYYDELKNLIKSYAKYQLYGELGLSSEPSETMTFPTLRIPSKKFGNLYSFVASPYGLLSSCYVARRESGEEEYYQRLINANKLNKIKIFIKDNNFANNIILAIPPEISENVKFEEKFKDGNVSVGLLTIPKSHRSLWIVDGQHRLYGYSKLEDQGRADRLIQVVALENATLESQRELFITINKEQTPVKADLIWDLYSTARTNDEKTGIPSRAAKKLNEQTQFKDKIYFPLSSPTRKKEQLPISKVCTSILDSRLLKGTLKGNNAKNPIFDKNPDHKIVNVAKGINDFYYTIEEELNREKSSSEFYNRFCMNGGGFNVMINLYSSILCVAKENAIEEYAKLFRELVLDNYSEKKQVDQLLRSINTKEGKREKVNEFSEIINSKISASGLELEKLPVSNKQNSEIMDIEKEFREFLQRELSKIDKEWIRTRTSKGIYDSLKDRTQDVISSGYDFLTLGQCFEIMFRNDNLQVFKEKIDNAFYSVDIFKGQAVLLREYRNSIIAHNRKVDKEKEKHFLNEIPGIIKKMDELLRDDLV